MKRCARALQTLGMLLLASTCSYSRAAGAWIGADKPDCKVWNVAPQSYDSAGWSGACSGGFAAGEGKLNLFRQGQLAVTLSGELTRGMLSGPGRLEFANGSWYSGDFKESVRAGKGEFRSNTGLRYVGEWADNRPHGQGMEDLPNGDRYEGQFFSGRKTGTGILYLRNGDRHEGKWLDGRQEGDGRYITASGTIRTGVWKGGTLVTLIAETQAPAPAAAIAASHPSASPAATVRVQDMAHPIGSYSGELRNGVPHGQGTMKFHDGGVFEGQWADNQHVNGRLVLPDVGTYIGELRDGRVHGTGTFHSLKGWSYQGAWKAGARSGKGSVVYSSGARFEGEFVDGKREGPGTFTLPGGTSYRGNWSAGQSVGTGTWTMKDGSSAVAEFADGAPPARAAHTEKPPLARVSPEGGNARSEPTLMSPSFGTAGTESVATPSEPAEERASPLQILGRVLGGAVTLAGIAKGNYDVAQRGIELVEQTLPTKTGSGEIPARGAGSPAVPQGAPLTASAVPAADATRRDQQARLTQQVAEKHRQIAAARAGGGMTQEEAFKACIDLYTTALESQLVSDRTVVNEMVAARQQCQVGLNELKSPGRTVEPRSARTAPAAPVPAQRHPSQAPSKCVSAGGVICARSAH